MRRVSKDTKARVTLTLNGKKTSGDAEPRMLLTDFLRHEIGLTGTHVGCEHGVCGACTVLLDDEPVRACLMLAVQADRHGVSTIEGVAPADGLHPIQEAFWAKHGLQCGYCTPGMIMAAEALLRREPRPSEAQIRDALAGNLCRCTGYVKIVESVQAAARG